MTARNLNPNHPVTQFMNTEWVKIVALMMHQQGVTKLVIPDDIVMTFGALCDAGGQRNVAIKFTDGIGIQLFLVDDVEAERLAREQGGLPV